MKTIVMPKVGTVFSVDKTKKLDYTSEVLFVTVGVYENFKTTETDVCTIYSYKHLLKCVFNKSQFETFLYSEGFTDERVNVTFETN